MALFAQTLPPLELPLAAEATEQGFIDEFRKAESAYGTDSPLVIPAMAPLLSYYGPRNRPVTVVAIRKRALHINEAAVGRDHPDSLRARFDLADVYLSLDQYELAQAAFGDAVERAQGVAGAESTLVAQGLRARARRHARMGNHKDAIDDRRRAVAIQEKLIGAGAFALSPWYAELAGALVQGGQYAEALAWQEKARDLLDARFGPGYPNTLQLMSEMAQVLYFLGQYERSEAMARAAMDVQRATPQQAAFLRNRGMTRLSAIAAERGQLKEALDYQLAALKEAEGLAIGRGDFAAITSNTGYMYLRLGQPAEATPYLERALAAMRSLPDPESSNVARTLNSLARVSLLQGDLEGAQRRLDEAYLIAVRRDDPLTRSAIAESLAGLAERRGRRAAAIYFAKEAVADLQLVRVTLAPRQRAERDQFVDSRAGTYRQLAGYLLAEGRILESQGVLRLLKEDEYDQFLRGTGKAEASSVELTGTELRFSARQNELAAEISALGRELGELQRRAKLELTPAERERRAVVEARLGEAKLAFESFLTELYRELAYATPERNREVGERQLMRLTAMRRTLKELGDGVVLVHYLVADKRIAIILTTPTVQVARESAVDAERLNRAVRDLRMALQDRREDVRLKSKVLHDLLIAPIEKDLDVAGAKILMLSLDGVLRYIPFAALHDGERFLVERYETTLYTEAARDKLKDRPQAAWRIAAMGVTQGVGGFEPLPSVRDELEGIRGKVIPGEIYLDREFTVERIRDSLDKGFPLVHIASHFRFRPGTEADSFLLMGDGTRLSLQSIRERNFDFGGVDLITLSACETAAGGGRDETGREVEGFGALVQNLGAKGVVATLWPVADQSTGEFMQSLYRTRQAKPDTTKAYSLRSVQLEFLKGRYSHPFYWAPFVLMGNWL